MTTSMLSTGHPARNQL